MKFTKMTKKQSAERLQAIESVTDALDEFDIDASENQIIEFVDSYGADERKILNELDYADIAETYKFFNNLDS
jgi:hypothetical protein